MYNMNCLISITKILHIDANVNTVATLQFIRVIRYVCDEGSLTKFIAC